MRFIQKPSDFSIIDVAENITGFCAKHCIDADKTTKLANANKRISKINNSIKIFSNVIVY